MKRVVNYWSACKGILAAAALVLLQPAHAERVINIVNGADNPTPIAVVPFSWTGSGYNGSELSDIVSMDLYRSGQFAPIDKRNMISQPHSVPEVVYRDWKMSGADYVVVGQLEQTGGGIQATFSLCNVNGQKELFTKTIQGGPNNLRDLAHFVSDEVYETLTGVRGVFSTRVIYVRASRSGGRETSSLYVADQDGAREQLLMNSGEPILSPVWSPDGKQVAYVSFEGHRPGIYRQVIATGQRERLTSFKGLNSAPDWSPDGRRLALTLSKDGNPELYTLDLITRQLTRVTNSPAIDTEPSWTPDGNSLVFTSSRGGKPQLYKTSLTGGMVERLTFEGDYNAHGHITPDNTLLAFIHRRDGIFHTAVQDMKTGRVKVLTDTDLDESPAVAPNGRLLMYSTQEGTRSILSTVSVYGGVRVKLPLAAGELREPAWGPFKPR